MQKQLAIVLAAGKGTRMKSELPKVLVAVDGRPMVHYVLDALEQAGVAETLVVVGYRAELVRQELKGRHGVTFVDQPEQLGTGHAVMVCREHLAKHDGPVLVVAGDSPLLQPQSLRKLFGEFAERRSACLLGTGHKADPHGLGRIVRDAQGSFQAIVEEAEARLRPVSGVALAKGEARITVLGVPDRPGTSEAIFTRVAAHNVTVDMIVQNIGTGGHADVSFTVARDDLSATLEAVEDAVRHLGAEGYSHDQEVAKLSVVGLGMATQTGVAEKMFRALANAGINLQMISTSEIKISVLVAAHQAGEAVRVVHRAFTLERPPTAAENGQHGDAHGDDRSSPVDIVRSLQQMEELTIDEIALDESQARVSVSNVPDQPGIAARVFEEVAKAGIFVDMIVQSTGRDGRANLSFTVPQTSLKQAVETAKKIGAALGCGGVDSAPQVAKLSVTGIGMRSHASVATRTFEALAAAGINIEMVSTSEVRVNVVVQGDKGPVAMRKLQEAFADVLR